MKNGKIKLITKSSPLTEITPKFDKVIGQASAIKKMAFFIETHDMSTPLPTFLLTGSHGLGKTYIAEKIANCMGRRFIEVNSGMLDDQEDLVNEILLGRVIGDTPATLFFDESHRLNSEVTTALLSLLNPSSDHKNYLNYKEWSIEFDMRNINVIFATTDAHRMFGPLVNRCERIFFDSYNHDDLLAMLHLYCPDAYFCCNKEDLTNACRGRGRDAFQLAGKISRYLNQKNTPILSKIGWGRLKNIFEIYPLGLNRQEVELLHIVSTCGPISVANIALSMMLNTDNIESEIEVRPRELGLLQSTTRGRVLTEKGEKYIKKIKF
ncbi:MAG: AAA family ATPase [Synergistaceae bacterium]